MKVAVSPPAGTVTLAGTVTAELLLCSVTTAPPEGAGLFSVIVPVAEVPPLTVEGFIARVATEDPGLTVNIAVC